MSNVNVFARSKCKQKFERSHEGQTFEFCQGGWKFPAKIAPGFEQYLGSVLLVFIAPPFLRNVMVLSKALPFSIALQRSSGNTSTPKMDARRSNVSNLWNILKLVSVNEGYVSLGS